MDMNVDTISTGRISAIKTHTKAMATISENGEVAIDWDRVKEEAAGNDRYLKAVAQALIAVRDGTYRPMP